MLPDELTIVDDSRGMASLLELLGPASPAQRAAAALRATRERLLLCTGFPIERESENDGPAGAIVLARSLRALHKEVVIASWPEALAAWEVALGELPRCALGCGQPLARLSGAPVTIEVCGRNIDGRYENMYGEDLRADAPWFEDAIGEHALVSIGDGGNEFGFGGAPSAWFAQRRTRPPISSCEVLVVGQVSNWAALAVVAALERDAATPLLPSAEQYQALLESLAARGVVDGVRKVAEATEDGWPPGYGMKVVDALASWARA